MIPFYSKRNQVYPVVWKGRTAVENILHFSRAGSVNPLFTPCLQENYRCRMSWKSAPVF